MSRYFWLLAVYIVLPVVTLAQEESTVKTFTENIPFIQGDLTTSGFVTALYSLAIALAAIAVVIRLILAGAKYMLSEVVSSKSKAKEDIKNALLGLLIILAAVLILGTINPKLVGLNVLGDADPTILNPDKDPKDNIGLKPGDSYPASDIAARCSEVGITGSALQEKCVSDNESELLESCKHNGGRTLSKTFDPNVSWGGYAWYSYTCQ